MSFVLSSKKVSQLKKVINILLSKVEAYPFGHSLPQKKKVHSFNNPEKQTSNPTFKRNPLNKLKKGRDFPHNHNHKATQINKTKRKRKGFRKIKGTRKRSRRMCSGRG